MRHTHTETILMIQPSQLQTPLKRPAQTVVEHIHERYIPEIYRGLVSLQPDALRNVKGPMRGGNHMSSLKEVDVFLPAFRRGWPW